MACAAPATGSAGGPETGQPLLRAFVYRKGAVCCTAAFDKRQIVIGRLPQVDLVLDCETVSRNHALVRIEGGKLVIEDLSSKNGVWVGGQAVTRGAVRPWEPVAIGSYVLRFHLDRRLGRPAGAEATSEAWALELDDERTIEEAARALSEPAPMDVFGLADLLEPEPGSGPQGPGAGRPGERRVTTLVTRAPELRRTSGLHSIARPGGAGGQEGSHRGGGR